APSLLGPTPRRSAFRANRRLVSAEKTVKVNRAVLLKTCYARCRMRYWEIIADKLSKAGWSWGCVATVDREGRTIFVADAHRHDGKRFVVRADEKLTAFLEVEATIR